MVPPPEDDAVFGEAARCTSLPEVVRLMAARHDEHTRVAAAGWGMCLVARSAQPGPYRDSALAALDQLARAKAELDISALHLPPVTGVTARILRAAQQFADEATIPCTEWPSVEEIAAVVQREARKLVMDSKHFG
jgi:hypothetical protein